jgi:hypothetical protein
MVKVVKKDMGVKDSAIRPPVAVRYLTASVSSCPEGREGGESAPCAMALFETSTKLHGVTSHKAVSSLCNQYGDYLRVARPGMPV